MLNFSYSSRIFPFGKFVWQATHYATLKSCEKYDHVYRYTMCALIQDKRKDQWKLPLAKTIDDSLKGQVRYKSVLY